MVCLRTGLLGIADPPVHVVEPIEAAVIRLRETAGKVQPGAQTLSDAARMDEQAVRFFGDE